MLYRFSAAIITFLVTVFGVFTNLFVFVATLKMSSMNSSFGIITKNMAICNTLMCLIFLIYIFPTQLSDAKFLVKHSRFLGAMSMAVYEISNLSHLLIALNRFCAVFLNFYYERIFSKFGTKIMLNVIWVASIIVCLVLYEVVGCYFAYDRASWSFVFLATPLCTRLTWYSDFTFNTSLVVCTIVVNLLTAVKAGRNSRMLMNAAGIKMSKLQKRRELNFIKQTFFQGTTIFSGQVTYYIIAPLLENPIIIFIVGTLWAFMHAFEGGIILASNQEIRGVFRQKKLSTASTFVSSVTLS